MIAGIWGLEISEQEYLMTHPDCFILRKHFFWKDVLAYENQGAEH